MSGTNVDPNAGGTSTVGGSASGAETTGGAQAEPWYIPRIGQLTAQRHQEAGLRQAAEARAETAERELAAANAKLTAAAAAAGGTIITPQPSVTGAGNGGTPTAADIDRMAEEKAANMIFTEKCNAVATAGRQEFTDFNTKIEAFKQLGGLPRSMLEATIEVPNGHQVLYALAGDMDETARIMGINNPIRQAAAIAIYAGKLTPKPIVPNTPTRQNRPPEPPATRVGQGSRPATSEVDLYNENVTSNDWFAARIKERQAAGNQRRRR